MHSAQSWLPSLGEQGLSNAPEGAATSWSGVLICLPDSMRFVKCTPIGTHLVGTLS